jgi:hypothetical protein
MTRLFTRATPLTMTVKHRPPFIPYILTAEAKTDFTDYVSRIDNDRLRNTYCNYSFLAQHGGDRERFCRDACAIELVKRGLSEEK